MWDRLNGVAGNLKSVGQSVQQSVSQLAADVLEGAEDLSNKADEVAKQLAASAPGKPEVSGRLAALKARLEADRARGDAQPARPDAVREAPRAWQADGHAPVVVRPPGKAADGAGTNEGSSRPPRRAHLPAHSSQQPGNQHSLQPRTQPALLEPSQPRLDKTSPADVFKPPSTLSPAGPAGEEPAIADQAGPPAGGGDVAAQGNAAPWQQADSNGHGMILMRDDFEDVPLNSPDAARTKSHARPPRGERSEGGSADPLLAAQLQRLKAQMLQSANAHEDEQERLEQEHQHKVAELEGEVVALRGSLSQAQQATAMVSEQHNSQMQQQQQQMDALRTHLEAVQQQNASLQQQLSEASALLAGRADAAVDTQQLQGSVASLEQGLARQKQLKDVSVQLARAAAAADAQQVKGLVATLEEQSRGASSEAEDATFLADTQLLLDLVVALEQQLAHRQQAEDASAQASAREAQAAAQKLAAADTAALELQKELNAAQAELLRVQRDLESAQKQAQDAGQQEQTPLAEGVAGDASASRERASEDGQQDAWQLLQDERAAHEEAKEHLEMLQEALRHVREEADQAAASLAERDAFWKSELEQERRTLAAAQEQLAQQASEHAAAVKAAASSAGGQHAELEQALADQRAACRGAQAEAERLAERVERLESSAAAAASQARERDAVWKQELEAERTTAAASTAAMQQRCQGLEKQLAELQQQYSSVQASLAAAERQAERESAAAGSAAERDAIWQAELAEQEHALQHLRQEALLQAHEHATQARVAASQQSSDLAEQLQEAKDLLLNEQTTCRALRQDLEEQMAAVEAAQAAAARASAGEEETERALEAQLRQARAECSRLQAEVDRLRSAEQTASAAASSSQLTAAAWAAQSQEVQDLRAQLAAAGEARAAAEQERDKAKQQLTRLKAALVGEQDAEEDKVRWRVDAEVRLVREELAAGAAQQEAVARSQLAEAQAQLAAAHERLQQTQTDLEAWEAAVAARDTELQNLQTALGELTYESEAAERLRSELRASHVECDQLRSDLAQARASVKAEADARSRAEADARQAVRGGQQQHEWEQRLQEEAAMLRRALGESMKRVNMLNSDTNSMVDRRIVVKLLVTFFERGQSPEVLQLMTRMLGFTEEDKRRMGIGVERKGVLRSVATMPFNLVKGGVALARGAVVSSPRAAGSAQDDASGLADQWIDFLIQQAAAAESAEEMAKQNGKPGAEQWSRQARAFTSQRTPGGARATPLFGNPTTRPESSSSGTLSPSASMPGEHASFPGAAHQQPPWQPAAPRPHTYQPSLASASAPPSASVNMPPDYRSDQAESLHRQPAGPQPSVPWPTAAFPSAPNSGTTQSLPPDYATTTATTGQPSSADASLGTASLRNHPSDGRIRPASGPVSGPSSGSSQPQTQQL